MCNTDTADTVIGVIVPREKLCCALGENICMCLDVA